MEFHEPFFTEGVYTKAKIERRPCKGKGIKGFWRGLFKKCNDRFHKWMFFSTFVR